MKLKYNPNDINSLTIAAIEYHRDRTLELVKVSTNTKKTPLEYFQEKYPKETVPMIVHVLSIKNDDRHASLATYVKVNLSDITPNSIFAWARLFQNDFKHIGELMQIGNHYNKALEWKAAQDKPAPAPKPAPAKKAVAKKPAVKKAPSKVSKKSVDLKKLGVVELRKMAQKKGIKGYASMRKAELISKL